jgi:hypothetical protein
MMTDKPSNTTLTDRLGALMGAVIPSCMEGLRLVELGQQRPLKVRERLVLFYNSPLCLHCNCKREKFNKERDKMRAIERERRNG